MTRVGLALLLAAAAPAASSPDARMPPQVGAAELADAPDAWDGRRVRVRAEVEGVRSPHLFTLDDRIGAGPDVIVLVPPPRRAQVDEGATVVVSGVVRRFVWEQLRRDHDWLDLTPDVYDELESRPVILADAVTVPEGADLLAAGPAPPATVSAGSLAQRPSAYAGREVTVLADVAEVLSPTVFTLDEDRLLAGPDVVVLLPSSAARPIPDGASVVVTGTVRRFVEDEIDRVYGWLHLDPALADELEGRAAIIATEVRTAAGESLYAH